MSATFAGGLAAFPLDSSASAVMSGIALVLAGVQRVVVMLRLMTDNTDAAAALANRVEHLSRALREQAKAPGKATVAWYSALARLASRLDLIKDLLDGVLLEGKKGRRFIRFRRGPKVVAELSAHSLALSELAVGNTLVIGADVAAVVHSGVQQLREGIVDVHGDARKVKGILERAIAAGAKTKSMSAFRDALREFDAGPDSTGSTGEGRDVGDVNCEDLV
jgi:hypothetical protein